MTDVSHAFEHDNATVALFNRVSFSLEAATTLAITGPSGSGKSTLLSIVAGITTSQQGQVEVLGQQYSTMNEAARARLRSTSMGFVFQDYRLISTFTALENVAFAAEIAGIPQPAVRARELLHELGLESRQRHFPSQLSGGEQQRVAIARAVVHRPALLICDEPTASLDRDNASAVADLVFRLSKSSGAAVVLATHDERLASRCDGRFQL